MSRLLKGRLQQHSTPGVLPYDQIESVTLVDAKWTQSIQTPNPVALTEFNGNKRMNGHRDDWRHRRFERSPTAEHFHSADHDFLSHASVCCLEHNKEWSDSTRKLRESYWIRRLNTLCPFGINKGD